MTTELVIGSKNSIKLQELRSLLKQRAPQIDYRSLLDFPPLSLQFTDGGSNRQRAEEKATQIARALHKPTLADEWLLVIPILGDETCALKNKELFQCNKNNKFLPNIKELLASLQGRSDLERAAYCECAMALSDKHGVLVKSVVARVEGIIAEEEKGRATPEFSSVFLKHDYNKTLGELAAHIAQTISPRNKALEILTPYFQRLL